MMATRGFNGPGSKPAQSTVKQSGPEIPEVGCSYAVFAEVVFRNYEYIEHDRLFGIYTSEVSRF